MISKCWECLGILRSLSFQWAQNLCNYHKNWQRKLCLKWLTLFHHTRHSTVQVENFKLSFLRFPMSKMQNLSDHLRENFLNFSKHSQLFILEAFWGVLWLIEKKTQGYTAKLSPRVIWESSLMLFRGKVQISFVWRNNFYYSIFQIYLLIFQTSDISDLPSYKLANVLWC